MRENVNVIPGLYMFYQVKSTSTSLLPQGNKLESVMSSGSNFWSCSTDNECQTDFMAPKQTPGIKFPGRGVRLQATSSLQHCEIMLTCL